MSSSLLEICLLAWLSHQLLEKQQYRTCSSRLLWIARGCKREYPLTLRSCPCYTRCTGGYQERTCATDTGCARTEGASAFQPQQHVVVAGRLGLSPCLCVAHLAWRRREAICGQTSSRSDRLAPNPFPYDVPRGTEHWVFWMAAPESEWPEVRIAAALAEAVDARGGGQFVWYPNPKMSVPDANLYHVQVFWKPDQQGAANNGVVGEQVAALKLHAQSAFKIRSSTCTGNRPCGGVRRRGDWIVHAVVPRQVAGSMLPASGQD